VVALATQHAIPAIYHNRDIAYATYAARILKGDKPADLPVQQSSKVELCLNLKTAKTLGVRVPLPLSGRADEIFE
jgi:putative tryptophan/tyrosine transport system substrate-binding protein